MPEATVYSCLFLAILFIGSIFIIDKKYGNEDEKE
jgi:hypothetical protein